MKLRKKTRKPKKTSKRPAARTGAPARPRVSRDQPAIPQVLQAAGRPLDFDELAQRAQRNGASARKRLTKELEELLQSGAIIRNRRDEYCLRERLALTVGTVSAHKDGHGFLMPDDRSAPIYLAPRQMQEAMHGDRAAVRISGTDHRGRPEGAIVEVLERNTREIVGRLYDESGICFVVPDNPRIGHKILVPRQHLGQARPGQVVLVKLVEQPSKTAQPLGHITRVLGEHAAPGMETDIAIHSHGLPFEFPGEVIAEAEAFGNSVSAAAKRGREDLRELPLVTIDGEDARDFDDAVYCEPLRGGSFRLLVAIADVASYVEPNRALDREAQLRGTSVYFPNRVLPMLPEALSNGLCSLNPNVDRLCMVCEMRVSADGKVTRAQFFEGLMRSAARLTYTKVAAYLTNPAAVHEPEVTALGEQLQSLYGVFKALHRQRLQRGALDFDAPELKVKFDAQGRIATFVESTRNDAHRLIEECMIAANVQAARFLKKHRIPTLYRVHGKPEEDRLEQLRSFLQGFNIQLPTDRELEPHDLSEVLARSVGHEEAHLIQTVVIRSMPQAVYQPENIGHFGLALSEYAHFTSPIRRYPDLMVHRGIRHILRGGNAETFPWTTGMVSTLGQSCSHTERRADEATRDAMSWLKCEFMRDKIGEEFDTLVTGVVDFGLFVQIKGMQIDGLVHVSALGADYFSRDKTGYRMVGARSGRIFRLGDHLRVRLINVVIDERKIDFELAEAGGGQRMVRGPWQRRRNQHRGRR
ncbi:ribonuclease R [Steroidobacter agaridevorans]|uniref:ribonuclease R n=1 Tax=Steroidobacter agaridevorans TaxID=2695856 RepID=UPI001324DD94|nr:ribonuclease R [Steroidobacter agaridevorans]GFE90878.1 ribonuclease R [Steroidobacter agaridevorans]